MPPTTGSSSPLEGIGRRSTGFACANTANGCVAAPALTSAVVGGQLPAAWLGFVYDNFGQYRSEVFDRHGQPRL